MYVLLCSGAWIRTRDHLLTLVPKFPMGVDYIIIHKSRGREALRAGFCRNYSLSG